MGLLHNDNHQRKLVRYVGIEIDPNKAIQARNKGLPVFYGDIGRQEVAEAFNVGSARAVIVCISEKAQTSRAVIALRRLYPNLKIFCRAADVDHANRPQKTLDVAAMVPILPEDNLLLTLPFGGAVLKSLVAPAEEVNAILESKRKEVLSGRGLQDNEELLSLLQLGVVIESEEPEVIDITPSDTSSGGANGGAEGGDEASKTVAAAVAVVEETKEKSPMVASVIEASCPGVQEEMDAELKAIESEDVEDTMDGDNDSIVGAANGDVVNGEGAESIDAEPMVVLED